MRADDARREDFEIRVVVAEGRSAMAMAMVQHLLRLLVSSGTLRESNVFALLDDVERELFTADERAARGVRSAADHEKRSELSEWERDVIEAARYQFRRWLQGPPGNRREAGDPD